MDSAKVGIFLGGFLLGGLFGPRLLRGRGRARSRTGPPGVRATPAQAAPLSDDVEDAVEKEMARLRGGGSWRDGSLG